MAAIQLFHFHLLFLETVISHHFLQAGTSRPNRRA
jgi:hypothetical protein